jgi:hypothetical protein
MFVSFVKIGEAKHRKFNGCKYNDIYWGTAKLKTFLGKERLGEFSALFLSTAGRQ